MPKQWNDLSKEEQEEFEKRDFGGDFGGDTGPSGYIDDDNSAEKGDARREERTRSASTRNGPAGNENQNS